MCNSAMISSRSDSDLDTSLSESLDEFLEGVFLTLGVVEEVLSVSLRIQGTRDVVQLEMGPEEGSERFGFFLAQWFVRLH